MLFFHTHSKAIVYKHVTLAKLKDRNGIHYFSGYMFLSQLSIIFYCFGTTYI